jgi:hypothetical protein
MALSASASYSDASSSGIQNSGNNAVITHGRNGANLPAFPFSNGDSVLSVMDEPVVLLAGAATLLFVLFAVIGGRK